MKIIPVIHMLNENQVRTNIQTCIDCSIDSVFLINHQVNEKELIKCGLKMKDEFPEIWIGINMLGVDIEDAVMYEFPFDGMWCDQTMTFSAHKNRKYKGQLFSGYNFKYQPKSKNSLKDIQNWTDVITTSGEGTGKETPLNKVKEIQGKIKTAIASGVSKDNIHQYKGIVDYILVASSITNSNEIIQNDKLKELIEFSN